MSMYFCTFGSIWIAALLPPPLLEWVFEHKDSLRDIWLSSNRLVLNEQLPFDSAKRDEISSLSFATVNKGSVVNKAS